MIQKLNIDKFYIDMVYGRSSGKKVLSKAGVTYLYGNNVRNQTLVFQINSGADGNTLNR